MSVPIKKKALLSDRLYISAEHCQQSYLDAYETQIEVGEDPYTNEKLYETHHHYHFIRQAHDQGIYAFNRGDLEKIYRVFHDFEIDDQRVSIPMSHPLKIRMPGGLSWRPYQPTAIEALSSRDDGILKSPPRSGKTVMLSSVICLEGEKSIVFAHQTDLLLQLLNTFEQFTNLEELRKKTGQKIVGFANDWEDFATLDVVLCTKQTFDHPNNRAKAREIRNLFGAVYVDEVHFLGADVYSRLVNRFPARKRQGVTATPKRKDGRDFLVESVMGAIIHEVPPEQVGQVPMEVRIVPTNVMLKSEDWVTVVTKLAEHAGRNDLILKNMAEDVKKGHTIIAVTDRKKQGQELSKRLGEMGIVSVFFNGSVTEKNRRKAMLDKVRLGEAQVMIGMRSMTTGLDIPRADMFYNLLPCANTVKKGAHEGEGGYEQQVTRVRTPFAGKAKCYVKDFIDHFGLAYGCLKLREKTYRKIGATLVHTATVTPVVQAVEAGTATETSF